MMDGQAISTILAPAISKAPVNSTNLMNQGEGPLSFETVLGEIYAENEGENQGGNENIKNLPLLLKQKKSGKMINSDLLALQKKVVPEKLELQELVANIHKKNSVDSKNDLVPLMSHGEKKSHLNLGIQQQQQQEDGLSSILKENKVERPYDLSINFPVQLSQQQKLETILKNSSDLNSSPNSLQQMEIGSMELGEMQMADQGTGNIYKNGKEFHLTYHANPEKFVKNGLKNLNSDNALLPNQGSMAKRDLINSLGGDKIVENNIFENASNLKNIKNGNEKSLSSSGNQVYPEFSIKHKSQIDSPITHLNLSGEEKKDVTKKFFLPKNQSSLTKGINEYNQLQNGESRGLFSTDIKKLQTVASMDDLSSHGNRENELIPDQNEKHAQIQLSKIPHKIDNTIFQPKTVNLSSVGQTNAHVISEIENYLQQAAVANEKNVGVIFKHDQLGNVGINVEKLSNNEISVKIMTMNNATNDFFQTHRSALISSLQQSGHSVTDFKIEVNANNGFFNAGNFLSEGSSGQNGSTNSNNGNGSETNKNLNQNYYDKNHNQNEHQRRRDLWEYMTNKDLS